MYAKNTRDKLLGDFNVIQRCGLLSSQSPCCKFEIMAKATPVPPSESSPSSSIQSDGPTSPRDTTPNKKGKSSRKMLTETQKNSNHKEAENKRRNMIRDQFTRLS